MSEEELLNSRSRKVSTQLKFLDYTIGRLEKKQVAESISKITRLEKTRG